MQHPKINTIMSTFRSTIAQLEKVAEKNAATVGKNLDKIRAVEERNAILQDEAHQAENISRRLSRMIEGGVE